MAATNYQFYQTRDMFRDYLSGYPEHPTFIEWNSAEAEDKAALLYVTFFSEITLAWEKSTTALGVVYVSQEDGVSTVLQYLMKNVDKISDDEERYTPNYIYKVCYNCLLKLWQTRGTDAQRSACEISNEYTEGRALADRHGDIEVNLWDLVPSTDDDLETQETKEAIWAIIHHMGPKAEKVVNHLINPTDTLHKVSKKSHERATDRLADVSVSPEEYDEIIEELKVKLAPFKDILFTI